MAVLSICFLSIASLFDRRGRLVSERSTKTLGSPLAVCSASTHGSVCVPTKERLSAVGSDHSELSDQSSPVETERKDGSDATVIMDIDLTSTLANERPVQAKFSVKSREILASWDQAALASRHSSSSFVTWHTWVMLPLGSHLHEFLVEECSTGLVTLDVYPPGKNRRCLSLRWTCLLVHFPLANGQCVEVASIPAKLPVVWGGPQLRWCMAPQFGLQSSQGVTICALDVCGSGSQSR